MVERCAARVGLMGNPSDGFHGKTLSFLISNFFAEVRIEANTEADRIEIIESVVAANMKDLCEISNLYGYSGGLRLLQATCKTFGEMCAKSRLEVARPFRITFKTNIPRMVGLSGSSAIVVAAFRGLQKFHNISLDDLGLDMQQFPQVILDIEKRELGIAAGLQDRVIQTYGGVVHMDFSHSLSNHNVYTVVDPSVLPNMYIAYAVAAGGDSGKVHSTVRARWEAKDATLLEGMKELGSYADDALRCLLSPNRSVIELRTLAQLMEKNFAMRRQLYGDAVVGALNIAVAEQLKQCGLSAKFTGSGGAFVCMRSDGENVWFDAAVEQDVADKMARLGFRFERINTAASA